MNDRLAKVNFSSDFYVKCFPKPMCQRLGPQLSGLLRSNKIKANFIIVTHGGSTAKWAATGRA